MLALLILLVQMDTLSFKLNIFIVVVTIIQMILLRITLTAILLAQIPCSNMSEHLRASHFNLHSRQVSLIPHP